MKCFCYVGCISRVGKSIWLTFLALYFWPVVTLLPRHYVSEYILYIYTKKKRQGGYYCCILCIFPMAAACRGHYEIPIYCKIGHTHSRGESVVFLIFLRDTEMYFVLLAFVFLLCSTAMPTYSEALIVSRFMWLSKSVLLFGKELGPRQFCAIYYHAFTLKVKGQFCGNKASESFPLDLSKCAKMRGSNW